MPAVISKATAPHYIWGQVCDGWRLVDQPSLSVIHERMPTGSAEVRHHHERARQFFFVLEGALTIDCDGVRHTMRPGEGLEMAPGLPHQARNVSADPVEFLVISAPSTRGDRKDTQ